MKHCPVCKGDPEKMETCEHCLDDKGVPSGKCPDCNGEGEIISKRCPKSWLDRECYDFLYLVTQMNEGLPPVDGGLLAQEAYFIDCARIFADERARLERSRNRKKK